MIAGTLTIGGVEYVVVPRSEYEAMVPSLPAKEAIQAVIARSLIRRRTEAGLGQKQLAAMAGVRQQRGPQRSPPNAWGGAPQTRVGRGARPT